MRKRKLLSKEKIQQIIEQHKQIILEIEQLGAMAEEHRREIRSRRRPRKRKAKQQLKSTDYLGVEQFADVIGFVKAEADQARAKSLYLCRAVINEMLLILMAETGLRASEICNLKLKICHPVMVNPKSRSSSVRDKSRGPCMSRNGSHRSLRDT